jgi:hypothetical protein
MGKDLWREPSPYVAGQPRNPMTALVDMVKELRPQAQFLKGAVCAAVNRSALCASESRRFEVE